jgi:arylsulfatase A-like enzyme
MRGGDLFAAGGTREPLVAEAARGRQVMVLDGTWKLIVTLRDFHYVDAFWRDAGATELYDLAHDPAETDDRASREQAVARALGARLAEWMAAHRDGGAAPAVAPSPEAERALRALGYVE